MSRDELSSRPERSTSARCWAGVTSFSARRRARWSSAVVGGPVARRRPARAAPRPERLAVDLRRPRRRRPRGDRRPASQVRRRADRDPRRGQAHRLAADRRTWASCWGSRGASPATRRASAKAAGAGVPRVRAAQAGAGRVRAGHVHQRGRRPGSRPAQLRPRRAAGAKRDRAARAARAVASGAGSRPPTRSARARGPPGGGREVRASARSSSPSATGSAAPRRSTARTSSCSSCSHRRSAPRPPSRASPTCSRTRTRR